MLALRGFDGTAFATRTTVLTVPDGTGEVNGIAQGTDGRLYVGISAPCDDCTPDRDVVGVGRSRSSPTAPTCRWSPTTSAPRSGWRSSPAPTTCS